MSASHRNNLPTEITEAILRLLPVKSLCRFKSVSKTWNSLISDPQFIKTHLHQHIDHNQTRKLILISDLRSLYSISINEFLPYLNSDDIPATGKELIFPSPPIWWRDFLGSCNGLVLFKDENDAIFLVNPTTQEVWTIPDSSFTVPNREFYVRYGFGYDSLSDDYKVLSLAFWDSKTVVTVYSLRSNSWRKLPDSPYDHAAFHETSSALINNNFHSLVSSSMIVAFSSVDEEFREIGLPDSFSYEETGIYDVVDIGGKLGVFLGSLLGSYELWVMEEYGVSKSWTKVFSYEFKDPVRPVCFVEGSNRGIVMEFDEVLVFNIDEGRCRDVRIVDGPSAFIVGGTYVESLESPARFITTP